MYIVYLLHKAWFCFYNYLNKCLAELELLSLPGIRLVPKNKEENRPLTYLLLYIFAFQENSAHFFFFLKREI